MALTVNTNISSLNAQRQMMSSSLGLDQAFERLSSGLRINSAADDAAGLQITDRLQSQILGLNQGNRNANDGISLAQTAEGAMEEITSSFQRVSCCTIRASGWTSTAVPSSMPLSGAYSPHMRDRACTKHHANHSRNPMRLLYSALVVSPANVFSSMP